jgi:hypothetical protein
MPIPTEVEEELEQYLNDYEAMLNEELDKHFSENDDEGEPLDD